MEDLSSLTDALDEVNTEGYFSFWLTLLKDTSESKNYFEYRTGLMIMLGKNNFMDFLDSEGYIEEIFTKQKYVHERYIWCDIAHDRIHYKYLVYTDELTFDYLFGKLYDTVNIAMLGSTVGELMVLNLNDVEKSEYIQNRHKLISYAIKDDRAFIYEKNVSERINFLMSKM